MRKRILKGFVLSTVLATALLTGCGGASGTSSPFDKAAGEMAWAEEEYFEEGEFNGMSSATADSGAFQEESKSVVLNERKLIKTVNMDVETKEFETLLISIEQEISAIGGYIENMDTYNGSTYSGYRDIRNASMTIRIPQSELVGFVNRVSEISNVTRRSDNVEDVTLKYVDMESRRDALKVEQTRLLELLEGAESLEDILTIEGRLTDVRYELESMESQLRTMDNKVNYSTVYLRIDEVKELTPVKEETVWERITNGFMESVENIGNGFVEFFIWFITVLPYLLVWATFVLVVLLVVLVISKRSKAKTKARAEQFINAQQTKQEIKEENKDVH